MAREQQTSIIFNGMVNEVIRIVLVVLGLLILLSLVSYHPLDPSLGVSTGEDQRNWIGTAGADVAWFLLQLFGLVAFVIPFAVGFGGWKILKSAGLRPSILKAIGFLLLLLSLTALCSELIAGSHLSFLSDVKDHSAGGLIGLNLFKLVKSGLHTTGALIVWSTVFVISLMGVLQISLEGSVQRLRSDKGWLDWIYKLKDWRHARQVQKTDAKIAKPDVIEPKKKEEGLPTAKPLAKVQPVAPVTSALSEETMNEMNITVPDDARPPVIIKTSGPNVSTGAAPNGSKPPITKPLTNTVGAEKTPPAVVSAVSQDAVTAPLPTEKANAPQPPKIGIKPPTKEVPALGAQTSKQATASASTAQQAPAGQNVVAEYMIERKPPDRVMEVDEFDDEPELTEKKPSKPEKKRIQYNAGQYQVPPAEMLTAPELVEEAGEAELLELAHQLEAKCSEFSVEGHVEHIRPGPVVTTFEFKPDPGVKYSRITGLVDDLCLAMRAESIRIDRIPGKSTVGIEVPNAERATIFLRDVIESKAFTGSKSKLALALGKSIGGEIYIADLTKMPHLLIAGATGAGKSVGLNSIVMSILFKASPDEVKFIMVDPKRLELGLYEGIPHLLTPIVTDPKRASNALRWAVTEMETRYRTLAGFGVRNIDQYNREISATVDRNLSADNADLPKTLPYIVVVIDELADLMMVASNDVEASITRLAQMARAVGIHLVLATQRPSVDVITGLIKANFPSRIAFRVSSKVDSRTIIDSNGAEQLLGQGDMLFLPPGTSRLVRVHGSYVDEKEINKVIQHIKQQAKPEYDTTITLSEKELESQDGGYGGDRDEHYADALRIVVQMGRASTSVLQRRLHIGYGRAAAILDCMEAEGLIGPSEGSKPREVKAEAKQWLERVDQMEPEDF